MKNNNDYKKDLRNAMNDLYDEKPKKKNVDKQNLIINRILIGLIVALIVVVCMLGFAVGKELFFNDNNNNTPPIVNTPNDENNNDDLNNDQNNIIDDNNDQDDNIVDDNTNDDENLDQEDDIVDEDTNIQDEVADGEIDTSEFTSDLFSVKKFTVTKLESQVRFDISCTLHEAGSVYLIDNGSLSIGPIELNAGTVDLYFEVHGNANYTVQFVSKNSEIVEYTVTKEMIQNEIK